MSNSVISKHSKSAFDESESITILKGLWNQHVKLKLFSEKMIELQIMMEHLNL